MPPRNKIKVNRELESNNKNFVGAADEYIRQQGYTESSMEAARRAAKANRYAPYRPLVGRYRDPGGVRKTD